MAQEWRKDVPNILSINIENLNLWSQEQLWASFKSHIDALIFAVCVGEYEWAQESLKEIEDVEDRVSLAEKYELELNEEDQAWANRDKTGYEPRRW